MQAPALADLENRDNVGVVELRDRLGLVLEPETFALGGEPARLDHLERHGAVELALVRSIDHTHPAPAQLLLDRVARRLQRLRRVISRRDPAAVAVGRRGVARPSLG